MVGVYGTNSLTDAKSKINLKAMTKMIEYTRYFIKISLFNLIFSLALFIFWWEYNKIDDGSKRL